MLMGQSSTVSVEMLLKAGLWAVSCKFDSGFSEAIIHLASGLFFMAVSLQSSEEKKRGLFKIQN